MALRIDSRLTPAQLAPALERVFELSAAKIVALEKNWSPARGTPVFTVRGRYTSRGWTEWTQGFQYGSALLQFEATGDRHFLEIGRRGIVDHMASHVSHVGVHDHGFNNVSTYGTLLRLLHEDRIASNEQERHFCQLALKVSGAIQASRWTCLADGTGFVHSFNGPHSLFVDTIRSLRVLVTAHALDHVLMGEQDARISLLRRALEHALNTARYNVYYGTGRDAYDVPGRTAHEAVFNTASGVFRCPNSQQGFSPFTTWTRGLAWALCGFAEQLEFLESLPAAELNDAASHLPWLEVPRSAKPRDACLATLRQAAVMTAEFYLQNSCTDGIPMWDTGAPHLHHLGDYLSQPSNPFNAWEPVDSSAAAIAAQGFLRLARALEKAPKPSFTSSNRFRQAGLTIARTLASEPYLSTQPRHQGLLLHSVYHRPNGWDHIAPGQKIPNGESSQWGDYHLRELALILLREARGEPPFTFATGAAS